MNQKVLLRGKFGVDLHRNGKIIAHYDFPNGIVDEGINHILDVQFNEETQVTDWYIGLVDNSSWTAFADADTMASHAGWIENEDYEEVTRPQWTVGEASERAVTNAVSVDFSINDTVTIKGVFIASSSTKGGTSGVLWSTGAFGAEVPLQNGDTLKITYTVTG
jgi:hypothetical protein